MTKSEITRLKYALRVVFGKKVFCPECRSQKVISQEG